MGNLDFIKLQKNFKYSVNIKYDINDYDKINSFIPTNKNIELFKEIFNSLNNKSIAKSHILIGSYGTGKSLFATIIASLLSNKDKLSKFNKFLSNIKHVDISLFKLIKNELNNEKPYLILLPSYNNNSFKQSILLALKKSLNKNNIEDILPYTYFEAVEEKVKDWKKNYKQTYNKFEKKLKHDKNISINNFLKKISLFDEELYEYFLNLYPKLTAGGTFNNFFGLDLEEVISSVNTALQNKGYKGIYIIFDEFNKLLEKNIDDFDGLALQNLAEKANNSEDENLHLLLISHKNLSLYTSSLSKNQQDSWKKYEKRFKTLDASEYSSQIYELICNVLRKEKEDWEIFYKKNKNTFNELFIKLNKFDLFSNYDKNEKLKYIIKGCYPLHPISALLLPKLSQKIAQNERTLFTFLSTYEKNSLGDFIKKFENEKSPILRLNIIYDYFEKIMQNDLAYKEVHNAWKLSQIALQKIDSKDTIKKKIIKSLGVIYAVNEFSNISPSREIIYYIFNNLDKDIVDQEIDELINKKIILEKKSLNRFVFFEGSEIDFDKIIQEEIVKRKDIYSLEYLLDDELRPSPIYPKKYNFQYEIRRYFLSKLLIYDNFIDHKNLDKLFSQKKNSYKDGMILYILTETKKQINETIEKIKNIKNKKIIFVVPKKPIEYKKLLERLDALYSLINNKELLDKDPLSEKELLAYIDETKNLLFNKIDEISLPVNNFSNYYYQGKIIHIEDEKDLSIFVSDICENIYSQTPYLNNELIVRNRITGVQINARKDINKRLLFNNEFDKNMGIDGYGPNFLIYLTLIKNNKILKKSNKKNKYLINSNYSVKNKSFEKNKNLHIVFNLIFKLIRENKKISFGDIYRKLIYEPYGIRYGIIPFLIILSLKINKYFGKIIILHNGEEKKIDEKLFENINKYPDRYSIKKISLTKYEKEYLNHLEELYQVENHEHNLKLNRFEKLYSFIYKWFNSISNYAHKTDKVSINTKILRKLIKRRTNSYKKLLIDIIPMKLLNDKIKKKNIDEIKNIFDEFYRELTSIKSELISDLEYELTNIFNSSSNLENSIIDWYENLDNNSKNFTYGSLINSFLKFIRNYKKNNSNNLIKGLALIITGFNIEDWDDKKINQFLQSIKRCKNTVEGREKDKMDSSYDFKISFINKEGKKIEKTLEEVNLSNISKMYRNRIFHNIKEMQKAIDDKEKYQILAELIQELLE